jgi:hypothetical protein
MKINYKKSIFHNVANYGDLGDFKNKKIFFGELKKKFVTE